MCHIAEARLAPVVQARAEELAISISLHPFATVRGLKADAPGI